RRSLQSRDGRELEGQPDHRERPPTKTDLGEGTKAPSEGQPEQRSRHDRTDDEQHRYRLRARPLRSEAEFRSRINRLTRVLEHGADGAVPDVAHSEFGRTALVRRVPRAAR